MNTRVKLTYNTVAYSKLSVSWGAVRKTARDKIKKTQWEEAKEHLWANLTKGGGVNLCYRTTVDSRRREYINKTYLTFALNQSA